MQRSKIFALIGLLCAAAVNGLAVGKDGGLWTPVDTGRTRQMAAKSDRDLPRAFSAFLLDEGRMTVALTQSPEEYQRASATVIELPMPDGSLARFNIEHSLVVEQGLLKKYPELGATYRGYGIDDPTASVRFDMLPSGFHAMILGSSGTVLIDPQEGATGRFYISYLKNDSAGDSTFSCEVGKSDFREVTTVKQRSLQDLVAPAAPEVSSGTLLRTYRLALAADNEYCAAAGGGTVAGCLAAEVLIMNRVNGVYERDLAIHMNIIANNDSITFATNTATGTNNICVSPDYTTACTSANDPYTNNNGSTMLGQNATTLDARILTANYDIGHVFSTGGGGIATLNGPCGSSKARGVTGLTNPFGDAFAIDYVAHEMGHQFGANHTFNGNVSNCSGGNLSPSSAYEPGSGISIMAYAGICGNQDLALHSIDTFHIKSLEAIMAYSQSGTGNNCAVTTPTGNTVPAIASLGGPYTIPAETPFALTASATDADGDTLTYDWEEYDLGAFTTAVPNSDSDGTARPIFRPYLPSTSGVRVFPALNYILNNANLPPATYNCGRATPCLTGELLPTLTRTLNFQVIVRDNRANAGGVNARTVQVNVNTLSGPFLVTAPNTAVSVTGGQPLNVTWQVADSNLAPVNATNVDILLSTDGGFTFPTVLAAATPNDGSQTVTMPNVNTTTARVKVQATGNIFFDISNTNFTINAVNVTVSGRVTAGGRGVTHAVVTLADQFGGTRTVLTGRYGFFAFANVPAGQMYTVSVMQRRFTFTPQVVPVNDNVTNLSFVAQ